MEYTQRKKFCHLPNGQKVLISTVRLPVDYGFGGHPLWYEIMVFTVKPGTREVESWSELYCDRYATAKRAKLGHEATIDLVLQGKI